MSDIYDTDILMWSEVQSALLRRRAAGELVNDADVDWTNIAEEIEAMGRSERRELRRRVTLLLHHLLKWQYQPDHRSRSWQVTIATQRDEIAALIADSPSLRPTLPDVITAAYPAARRDAMLETGLLALPDECPITLDELLGE